MELLQLFCDQGLQIGEYLYLTYFFNLKEALAFLYQRARLWDRAIRLYQELEDLFLELNSVHKSKGGGASSTLPTMDTFGGPPGADKYVDS